MIRDHLQSNENVKPNTAFLEELKNKLPEFFNDEGFDIEKFQNALKENDVNEFSEGYQLNFIGKDYARKQAGDASTSVIVPDNEHNQKEENKNSKNLFFTGDNLEVLRHLRNNYSNKIDVIYIDPPYNTGNDDFVYPDKFEYSDKQLKEVFGMSDKDVSKLNALKGSKSHSAWLTFMYPRLWLAKQLLTDDGVVFISIDDNEFDDLLLLLKELMGEANFIENYIWEDTFRPDNSSSLNRKNAEYIVSFAKNKKNISKLVGTVKKSTGLPSLTKNSMPATILSFKPFVVKTYLNDGIYKAGKKENGYELLDDIKVENGKIINGFRLKGHTIWKQNYLDKQLKLGTEIIIKSENMVPYSKKLETSAAPNKLIPSKKQFKNGVSDVLAGGTEVTKLFNGKSVFQYPKPVSLVKYLFKIISDSDNYTFLDLFAGSATTADAVMQLNAEDGGKRKFIMVQLPEKTYEVDKNGNKKPTKGGKAAFDAGYMSIDEISRERIKRAAKKIKDENPDLSEDFDGGFKHYRVVSPQKETLDKIYDFDPERYELVSDMIDSFSSSALGVPGNASGEDTILTTWLAEDGYDFNTDDLVEYNFAGYKAYGIKDTRLYLIDGNLHSEQIKELLNQLGTNKVKFQSIVVYGYSFNVMDMKELERGLLQLNSKVNLIKRY